MSGTPTPLADQILRLAEEKFWSQITTGNGMDFRVFDAKDAVYDALRSFFSHIWEYEDASAVRWRLVRVYRKLYKELWPGEPLPKAHPLGEGFAWLTEDVRSRLASRLTRQVPQYNEEIAKREKLVKEYKIHPTGHILDRTP